MRLLGGESMTFFFSLSAKEDSFFWGCLKQGQGVLAAVWNRVSSLVGPWSSYRPDDRARGARSRLSASIYSRLVRRFLGDADKKKSCLIAGTSKNHPLADPDQSSDMRLMPKLQTQTQPLSGTPARTSRRRPTASASRSLFLMSKGSA